MLPPLGTEPRSLPYPLKFRVRTYNRALDAEFTAKREFRRVSVVISKEEITTVSTAERLEFIIVVTEKSTLIRLTQGTHYTRSGSIRRLCVTDPFTSVTLLSFWHTSTIGSVLTYRISNIRCNRYRILIIEFSIGSIFPTGVPFLAALLRYSD